MRNEILDKELTFEEQKKLLWDLFALEFRTHPNGHMILHESYLNQFYANPDNLKFNFSTLRGFFQYMNHLGNQGGYKKCQNDIRITLGINRID